MSPGAEQLKLPSWLIKAGRWWDVVAICGLAAFAVLLRCARLFDSSINYVLNPDSYFFHWVAQRVIAGEGPPPGTSGVNYHLNSGFAYPAAYFAKALGSVFNLSPADSLELVFKLLPPAVAVISLAVLYIALVKLFNRRVAFFSCLTWALLFNAVFVGAAGNLDRDSLSVLLLLAGAVLFYVPRGWRFKVGTRDVGWVVSGFSVLVVQILLYLEWGPMGAVVLFAIILVYSVVKLLMEYLTLLDKEPRMMQRIALALRRADLRAVLFVAAIDLSVLGVHYNNQFSYSYHVIVGTLRGRLSGRVLLGTAAEETGLSFGDLLNHQFFLVPIALGVYLAWKRGTDATLFFASWFVSFFILSLFSYRMIILAVPAACVVSGVGLAYLWEVMGRTDSKALLPQLGIIVLLLLLLVISWFNATSVNSNYILAADKDWQEALTYLREDSPQNAVVMSQWSYGYWILDLANRQPLVDNGYYGVTPDRLRDVGLAYSTTDPSEAAAVMVKNGTDYLVFGKQDLDLASPIMAWAGLGSNESSFPDDSLIVRSLNGEFLSGDGLEVVFRNSEVVILALAR